MKLNSDGLFRYAVEYFVSAEVVLKTWSTQTGQANYLPNPLYYLYGHSIELAIKAFLLQSGTTDAQLRKISHGLKKCLTHAKEKGLEIPPFHRGEPYNVKYENKESKDSIDEVVLIYLDQMYHGKRFEYFSVEEKILVDIPLIQSFASRLIIAVASKIKCGKNILKDYEFERYCYQAMYEDLSEKFEV
jgi:hypothetical protein